MSVVNDVLTAVVNMINDLQPYSPVIIGSMPPDNGLSIAIASGAPDATFLTKSTAYSISVVFNGKHSNQQIVSDFLNNAHQALTQATAYPATDTYQITNIETIGAPNYIGREQNNQWLYGSSLAIKFYYLKG